MNKIPEAEARAILATPRTCEDCRPWTPQKQLIGAYKTDTGLLDPAGVRSGLFVDLYFYRSPKTNICVYKFSVFKMTPSGSARVYQLDVRRSPKPIKDAHGMAHEHFGNGRTDGDASWNSWSYNEVMHYFCRQANITFDPALSHPEHFELTS
ncbi:hypothetical protein ACOTF6_09430 [Achromobacter xylosoxidans]